MDAFDAPKSCPRSEGVPLRYSVGFYRGKRRIIIAWFVDESVAIDYLRRFRRDHPRFKADLLQSLF